MAHRLEDLGHGIAVGGGDDLPAGLVVGGMEGKGKAHPKVLLRQAVDALGNAHGGEGDAPWAHGQALGMEHDADGLKHVAQVQEGLPHAHEDHVSDIPGGDTLVVGDGQELGKDLRRGEVAAKAQGPGGAEGAPRGAAHHAGEADSLAVLVGHVDGFRLPSVQQGKEVLDASVPAWVGLHQGKLGDAPLPGQGFPEALGQVGHLGEVHGPPGVEPVGDLGLAVALAGKLFGEEFQDGFHATPS